MLNNEVRYLEPTYSGVAHLDVLPGDHLTNSTRSLFALNHTQNLGNGLNGFDKLQSGFRRCLFPRFVRLGQHYLTNYPVARGRAVLFGRLVECRNAGAEFPDLAGSGGTSNAAVQSPPAIYCRGAAVDRTRKIWHSAGEFADFRHPTLVNGQRLVLYPSVSYPLVAQPAFYLTPKFGLHYTNYSMGVNNFRGVAQCLAHLADFQPGQRNDDGTRNRSVRAGFCANAGAARVLRVHPLSRPETSCRISTRRRATSILPRCLPKTDTWAVTALAMPTR